MICTNERDHNVAAWLRTVATPEQIAGAVTKLANRAWPAKVASSLGLVIPDEVWDPEATARAAAAKALALEKLRQLRNEFKTKGMK